MDLNYYYSHFVSEEFYLEHPQIITLSSILPDPINTHSREFINSIVDEINGKKIKTLQDVADILGHRSDHYIVRMLKNGKPLVIEHEQVEAAQQRIRERYGVIVDQYINNSNSQPSHGALE